MQKTKLIFQSIVDGENLLRQKKYFVLKSVDFAEYPLAAFIRWAQIFFWKRQCLVFIIVFAISSPVACAQDRDDDDEDEMKQTEIKDKDVSASSRRAAAKRAKKAERKTRKEKKDGKSAAAKLPPAPDTPPELEFFDGAIFSRKVNLGLKNVLCFASERRPLAMLWKEAGQADARREGSMAFPVKLTGRELQLIFGRPVDAAQISVLNENGQMLSRGAAVQVTFDLARQPVYLLLEMAPSRPRAAIKK
jgi:hypothetical protein